MTQKNHPGYPLPSGSLGEDEIVCQLVYLPDRNEYWQALLGAISYMATWKAWERDSAKRGKDAAANWREAFELTMECWRMTCLDDLTQTVTDILELLQTRKDCCDDNITYLPQPEAETEIDPGVGDPPDYYGETAVADWDEWHEYLCFSAHKYVDYLVHVGDQLNEATAAGSLYIGLIAAALSLLAASGIGLPIAFLLAAAVTSGIILSVTLSTFSESGESIEASRTSIVCAIMHNYGLADAVELALESGLDWDLFYQFIAYDTAMAVMLEGGYEGEYLPAELLDTCDCECYHLVESPEDAANTVNAQDSSGANMTLTRRTLWGAPNVIYGQFSVNHFLVTGWCGPMKVIDTISVSDGLKFSEINTYDQDGVLLDHYHNESNDCSELIGQLVGDTVARFNFIRFAPTQGGCGVGTITITMTYHDA